MIEHTPNGIIITVRVIPRARKSGLAGVRGEALLLRLQAPPVEGAANTELVGILAAALRVPKRAITIIAGDRTRHKRVRVLGIDPTTAMSRLVGGT